jgi:hypothetical protein
MTKIVTAVSLVGMALAQASWAGPTDTPLRSFTDGKASVHVYTAVGVIKNNDVETAFICTNLDTVLVNIGVEVFTNTGGVTNRIDLPPPLIGGNGAVLDVAVGQTVTISTSGTALLTEDETIGGLPNLRNGSGRVVATTKNIACTAMLLDELHEIVDPLVNPNIPPPTVVNLPLIRVP